MSRISSLNYPGVGTSAALLGEEGRAASEMAQSEMTISQLPTHDAAGQFKKPDLRLTQYFACVFQPWPYMSRTRDNEARRPDSVIPKDAG
jgi:hypothetical protein